MVEKRMPEGGPSSQTASEEPSIEELRQKFADSYFDILDYGVPPSLGIIKMIENFEEKPSLSNKVKDLACMVLRHYGIKRLSN